LQKAFCTADHKFSVQAARLCCKDVGTSTPDDKLTGDLSNVTEAKISDLRSDRAIAGKLSPENLQQRSFEPSQGNEMALRSRSGTR